MSRVRDEQAIYAGVMTLVAAHPDLSPAKAVDVAIECYDVMQDTLRRLNERADVLTLHQITDHIGTKTWGEAA